MRRRAALVPRHYRSRNRLEPGSVAPPGHSLDKPWIACRIAEGVPQAADRRIEAVIKIDESIGRPEPASQLLAGNDFSGLFEKLGEDLEGLLLQPDLQTLTP